MQGEKKYHLILNDEELTTIYDALRGGSMSPEYLAMMTRLAIVMQETFPHIK